MLSSWVWLLGTALMILYSWLLLKTNFELFGSHDWVPLSFWVELGNVYTILFPLGDTCERTVDLSGT